MILMTKTMIMIMTVLMIQNSGIYDVNDSCKWLGSIPRSQKVAPSSDAVFLA